MDNIAELLKQLKPIVVLPVKEGKKKTAEPKKVAFHKLVGYAKFRWKDSVYARLNNRLALRLSDRTVEFMETTATVEVLGEDYLHGLASRKQEEFLAVADKPWEAFYHPDGEIRRKMLAKADIVLT